VIHQPSQWQSLKTFRPSTAIPVWLKLDTGMHRLGLSPEQLGSLYAEMSAHPSVRVEGFMSHLANADDSNDQFTRYQLADFRDHCGEFGLPLSLANSAAICAWPDTHLDWVRPGLMLYGASPLAGRNAAQLGLRPVMRLVSELMAVRQLAVGDPVGYGGSWVCPEAMPVGIVACGYGDGYPRHAVNGTSVSVGGQRVPLVGRVSMDMLAVDLRQCPHAVPGTPVELWGLEPEVNTVATQAGTVGYELLCAVSARVPRQVHGA
jgi:alanine racemase